MKWRDEKEQLGKKIIHLLYEQGMIRTSYRDKPEGWILVSGIWSPFYIQLRPLVSYPSTLKLVGEALGKLVKNECPNVNRIVGVAMAGIPIATVVSLLADIPSCYTRKLEGIRSLSDFHRLFKQYGEHSMLEGELTAYDQIAIVDDLVTRLDSKLIAIEQVKFEAKKRELEGIRIKDIVVLFDREQGAVETATENALSLHSLIPFKTKGLSWLKPKLEKEEYNIIAEYL